MMWFFVALALEVCCLGVFFLTWMAGREAPLAALWGPEPGALAAWSSPTPYPALTALATLPLPAPGFVPPAETIAPVTTEDESQAILPHFDTPPPGKIVFTCYDGQFDQICLMNADGTDQRQLTYERATSFYPSLAPDGRSIIFSSNRDGNFEVYVMDLEGQNVIQVTNDTSGNLYAPEISSKGNRIIFTHESGGYQAIWVMKIDGRNPHPLYQTGGLDIDPTWSPDALQVAFTSGAADGKSRLVIGGADGAPPQPVTRNGPLSRGRCSWSPDGKWLAYYAGTDGDRNIFIVQVNGGNVRQLTSGGDNLAPSFSPDGQWLAFTSYRDGNNEIYLLRLSDQRVYRLTFRPGADWQARWGP